MNRDISKRISFIGFMMICILASVLHCILAHFCPKGLDILTGGRK